MHFIKFDRVKHTNKFIIVTRNSPTTECVVQPLKSVGLQKIPDYSNIFQVPSSFDWNISKSALQFQEVGWRKGSRMILVHADLSYIQA